ncbi:MAG TPA: hypothetical protein VFV31_04375 [Chitinophagaceae bacterium]|nr:hypothetical protein [Chitinophagaceae bacterium]
MKLFFILTLFTGCLLQSSYAANSFSLNPGGQHHFNDPVKIISTRATVVNNKIVLDWAVSANKSADRFIIEKSTDGKNYSVAALVFTTENKDEAHYTYFEKINKTKYQYRILAIDNEQKISCSAIIATENVQ